MKGGIGLRVKFERRNNILNKVRLTPNDKIRSASFKVGAEVLQAPGVLDNAYGFPGIVVARSSPKEPQ